MKRHELFLAVILIFFLWVYASSEEIKLGPFEFEHAPFIEAECSECHCSNTPNRSDVSAVIPELCYGCHDAFAGRYMHSPVGSGECLLCHDPHGSDNALFLKMKEPALCYLCHGELESDIIGEKSIAHEPALGQCTICHSPHVSDLSSSLLTEEEKKLCTECHASKGIAMSVDTDAALYKHKPIENEKSCTYCHDAHGSTYRHHLIAKPMDLCLKCHNEEVTDDDGKALVDIKKLLEENKTHHGPIKEKNCSGCHSPHGSDYYRLLLAEYPKEFYTSSYSKDDYNLCFLCHDSRMLKEKETTSLTRFRDGKRNLHYLHVNKPEKGRTCRACHEVHASNNFNHIRESVPFGKINWPLQLKFEPLYVDKKTGTLCSQLSNECIQRGGSCVACHSRKFYNNAESE